MRLLLVEDDDQIGEGVRTGLTLAGHAVDWVKRAETARAALHSQDYQLVVLDIGLPDACGFELLHEITQLHATLPVIVLSARDALADRLRGLNGGADDYLVKPFALDELDARVRAVERRRYGSDSPVLKHRDVCLDPVAHVVTQAGARIELSRREFALFRLLMTRRGKVLSRATIEEQLYAWGEEVESNAVEVHVHHLRKKLGADFIRTVRVIGYLIEEHV